MTTSQPLAADGREEKSRRLPTTSSQPRCLIWSSRDVRRTIQRTSRPRARSIRTTTELMKPLLPVTRIFIELPAVAKVGALRASTLDNEVLLWARSMTARFSLSRERRVVIDGAHNLPQPRLTTAGGMVEPG